MVKSLLVSIKETLLIPCLVSFSQTVFSGNAISKHQPKEKNIFYRNFDLLEKSVMLRLDVCIGELGIVLG
jgi:hypothetical protein